MESNQSSPGQFKRVVGQTFSPNGESCPHCGKDECCGGFMAVNIVMEKRNREELLGSADRLRERLAARVRFLESKLRDCLAHIDLLEGHLPMLNSEDESVYKDSILFGERIAACLPNTVLHLPHDGKESNPELTRPASESVPATGGNGLGSGGLLGADVLPEGKP